MRDGVFSTLRFVGSFASALMPARRSRNALAALNAPTSRNPSDVLAKLARERQLAERKRRKLVPTSLKRRPKK
ncbi:hypothetical protein [Breoghania sp.]|uniref:hypothetical protein n=1 Tax=Breoghania sp. TaxID=2065378 RepID=UPI00263282F2|nr:hypothetical protein [Breoghania sp.]MDJ0930132.1 hypothetical protein [Breoghania sp.]